MHNLVYVDSKRFTFYFQIPKFVDTDCKNIHGGDIAILEIKCCKASELPTAFKYRDE